MPAINPAADGRHYWSCMGLAEKKIYIPSAGKSWAFGGWSELTTSSAWTTLERGENCLKHITRSMAVHVINKLPSSFDAHVVEKRILRLWPRAFADELLRFNAKADQLRTFSALFGRWIDSKFKGQILKSRKVLSENLGGKQSRNQEWRKLSPQIT